MPKDKIQILKDSEKTTRNKRKFLKEFKRMMCVISFTCRKIGIKRATYYYWISKDMVFKARVLRALENQAVEVEDRLLRAIVEGNITAIIFYLKNKHPDYAKANPFIQANLIIPRDYDKLTDEELEQQIKELEQQKEITGGEAKQIGSPKE